MGAVALLPRRAHAMDAVPSGLQAQLLAKVTKYDRNFKKTVGTTARVTLLQLAGNGASEAAAGKLRVALDEVGSLAGVPIDLGIRAFAGAQDLAAHVTGDHVGIVYVMPGLETEIKGIASALSGLSVLSVAASPSDVAEGIVLGFALQEGKPKILVNLVVAKAQNVDFSSALLNIATVI